MDKPILLSLFYISLLFIISPGLSYIILSDQGSEVRNVSSGDLLEEGNLAISIWDSPVAGTQIYSHTFESAIQNGSWNVMLNITYPMEFGKTYYKDYLIDGDNLDFDGNDRLAFVSPLGLINDASNLNWSVVGSCPEGFAVRQILENGSAICQAVNGSIQINMSSNGWNNDSLNTNTSLNVNTGGNVTGSYGLFGYLGSIVGRITKIFATDIDVSGNLTLNGTSISSWSAVNKSNLSEFVNDAGYINSSQILSINRTHLSNFTNDLGFVNSSDLEAYNETNWVNSRHYISNNSSVVFTNVSADWLKGYLNWSDIQNAPLTFSDGDNDTLYYADGIYIYNNGSNYFVFNESRLNQTINSSSFIRNNTNSQLSNITLAGNMIPSANKTFDLGNSSNWFRTLWVEDINMSGNSLYMNGQKVLESTEAELKIYSDPDQSLQIRTNGAGNLQLVSTGSGNVQLSSNNQVQLSSNGSTIIQASGINSNIQLNAQGSNSQVQLTAGDKVYINPLLYVAGNATITGSSLTVGGVSVCLENGSHCQITSGNITSLSNSLVWQNGTWVQLKPGMAQNVNVSGVLFVNGSNVGIGTTAPAFNLGVVGTIGATDNIYAYGGSVRLGLVNSLYGLYTSTNDMGFVHWTGSAYRNDMVIKGDSGNVGIGTTAPGAKLDVQDSNSGYSTTIQLSNGADSGSTVRGINWASTAGWSMDYARISASYGTSFADSYMALSVADSAGTLTERMRIDKSGNVGIGTTNPGDKLAVYGTSAAAGQISYRITNTEPTGFVQNSVVAGSTNFYYYGFGQSYATSGQYIASSGLVENTGAGGLGLSATSGTLRLYTNNSEAVRILSAGNVGIGTTGPSNILSVGDDLGNVYVNKAITLGSGTGTGGLFVGQNAGRQVSMYYTGNANEALGVARITTAGNNNPLYLSGSVIALQGESTGNVGIGTTNPEFPLDVNGTISASRTEYDTPGSGGLRFIGGYSFLRQDTVHNLNFDVYNGGNFIAAMTVKQNGNVGIGTTSPSFPLHVVGNALITGQINANVVKSGYGTGNAVFQAYNAGDDFDFQNGSGDNLIYIKSTGNVGIGTTTPNQKLEVNGGMRLNTTVSKPTCDSSQRGTFWVTQGGAGVKDTVEVCAKDAGDAYAWRTIY